MIFSLVVARSVSKLLSKRSLYEVAIVYKSIPFLGDKYPIRFGFERAESVMRQPVHALKPTESVENLNKAYKTAYSSFPVVKPDGTLLGLLPRRFIKVLILEKEFVISSVQN